MPVPIRQGDIPGVQLRKIRELEVSRREVWRWLTEPELARRWLADEVAPLGEGDDGWRLSVGDETGGRLIESGRQESVEPGHRWVLIFKRHEADWESATRLTFELSGDDRCILSIFQQGFERLSLSRCLTEWELYRRRWRSALDRLARAIQSDTGA